MAIVMHCKLDQELDAVAILWVSAVEFVNRDDYARRHLESILDGAEAHSPAKHGSQRAWMEASSKFREQSLCPSSARDRSTPELIGLIDPTGHARLLDSTLRASGLSFGRRIANDISPLGNILSPHGVEPCVKGLLLQSSYLVAQVAKLNPPVANILYALSRLCIASLRAKFFPVIGPMTIIYDFKDPYVDFVLRRPRLRLDLAVRQVPIEPTSMCEERTRLLIPMAFGKICDLTISTVLAKAVLVT
jgi:hypothetical protein